MFVLVEAMVEIVVIGVVVADDGAICSKFVWSWTGFPNLLAYNELPFKSTNMKALKSVVWTFNAILMMEW